MKDDMKTLQCGVLHSTLGGIPPSLRSANIGSTAHECLSSRAGRGKGGANLVGIQAGSSLPGLGEPSDSRSSYGDDGFDALGHDRNIAT
jgi:hypothetical protein